MEELLPPGSLASGLIHVCLFLRFPEIFLAGLGVSQCMSEECVYILLTMSWASVSVLVAQSRLSAGIGQRS